MSLIFILELMITPVAILIKH